MKFSLLIRVEPLTGSNPYAIISNVPARNIIKIYLKGGYYHIYNRGVEKRIIFLDQKDYLIFIHLIEKYLLPPSPLKVQPLIGSNLYKEIEILSYCLMPNHFHFLVKQETRDAITKFMRRLCTSYAMYFNKRYERRGALFETNYRACLIDSETYLLHLSRYIHLNPLISERVQPSRGLDPLEYPYSSYAEYLGKKQTIWVKPEDILSYFQKTQSKTLKDFNSYQSFVENYKEDPGEILGALTLE